MREMNVEEFVRRFKSCVEENNDSKFLFFIGAGCSISSGIPSAGELVKMWLPKLKKFKTGDDNIEEDWAKEYFEGYDGTNASLYYGRVIEELFTTAQERQKEIERLIEGKDPGFGYAVLAQLIAHKDFGNNFNVLLTTNFDDLVADALYLFTQQKPLVITHEALAGFVRVTGSRPLVIKLHGDARLEPKNTDTETEELAERLKKVLNNLLSEMGIVFLGYGGNDKSIAEILEQLPTNAMPWGVYWIGDTIPEGVMCEWLEKRKSFHVKHKDFDEVMLLLWKEFELKHPDESWFQKILTNYRDSFKKLKDKVERKEPEAPEKKVLEEAVEKAVSEFPDWWAAVTEAEKYSYEDPERARKIYENSLTKFYNEPNYLGFYASFLMLISKDFVNAEKYFLEAISLDKDNAMNLGYYAMFLHEIKKEYDLSEEYYNKTLNLNYNNSDVIGNFALFLHRIRARYDEAEEYYKQSINLDTQNINNIRNYAIFLSTIRLKHVDANRLLSLALDINPKHVNCLLSQAKLLSNHFKNYKDAEALYLKALDIAPTNTLIHSEYGIFLMNEIGNLEKAEEIFISGMKIKSSDLQLLSLYSIFLIIFRKDYSKASELLKRGAEIEPENLGIKSAFAILFYNQKEYEKAEEFLKFITEKDPTNSFFLDSYAAFLISIRRDYTNAERYLRLSFKYDPNNILSLGSYAILQKEFYRDFKKAESLYKTILSIEPDNVLNICNYSGLLFSLGRNKEGNVMLAKLEGRKLQKAIELEFYFYKFAHNKNRKIAHESLRSLKLLLCQGERSPNFNLIDNVKQAIKDGHPEPEFLEKLAKVISDEIVLNELEKLEIWENIII